MLERIPVERSQLELKTQLFCGQAFCWQKTGDEEYSGEIYGHLVTLQQTDSHLLIDSTTDCIDEVRNYFQLDVNLTELYEMWSLRCLNFREKARTFTGIRMLRQNPTETVFAFICSANNNISRITKMVLELSKLGQKIGTVNGVDVHRFPTAAGIFAKTDEEKLRKLGFGYRAKYIVRSAEMLANQPHKLEELRTKPYEECVQFLLTLCGVGPKVADCICLMSLDKHFVVPVDTHVFNIAKNSYGFGQKALTATAYRQIGELFKELFGDYAGWAHSILFTANLKKSNKTKK